MLHGERGREGERRRVWGRRNPTRKSLSLSSIWYPVLDGEGKT